MTDFFNYIIAFFLGAFVFNIDRVQKWLGRKILRVGAKMTAGENPLQIIKQETKEELRHGRNNTIRHPSKY